MSLVLTFIGTATNAVDGASFTFTATPIGVASSDRLVILGLHSEDAAGATQFTGVTLDGNAATIVGQTPATTDNNVGIATLLFPSGTSADIVVTLGAVKLRCAISVWTLTGYISATPFDSDFPANGAGPSESTTIDLPAGSAGIAVLTIADPATAVSWDTGTERYDQALEANANINGAQLTGGSGSGTVITATATPNAGGMSIASASWLPMQESFPFRNISELRHS